MNEQQAREAILALLREKGRATNFEMQALVGPNRELFERIRQELILEDRAADKDGVGLIWKGAGVSVGSGSSENGKFKLFLSYGRADARELADRLCVDLAAKGYEVWRDTQEIPPGSDWQAEIADGLHSAQIVIALLSPHAVRTSRTAENVTAVDSVCLSEIAYARFHEPTRPVIPVMALGCVPPLAIYHLDYVDMQGWRDSPGRYQAGLERLLDYLASVKHGEKRYRAWYHQLQPFDFGPFLFPKRRDFCGRQWLFDQIDAWRMAYGRERALLIKGDPGVGKSAIVAELVHRNPEDQVIAYHCCQWDRSDTLEPWRFVRSVAGMIANALSDYAALLSDPAAEEALSEANCRADAGSALERGIFEPLQKLAAPEGGPRSILVDALDESLLAPAGSGTIVDLLASRLSRLPPWLRIVATTRKETAVLDRLQGLRAHEIDAQSAENRADVELYLRRRLLTSNLAEKLTQARRTIDEAVRDLVEKSEGHFLYVEQALEGIETDKLDFGHLDQLPPGLSGLYGLRFQRQFPDETSFAPVQKVLDVLVAAQEPLGKDELAGASGLERDRELPRTLARVGNYLRAIQDSEGIARYQLFHKSLTDWLTTSVREGMPHAASVNVGHRRLADWAWSQYASGPAGISAYARRHLPAHLIAAERWDNIETLLTDLKYLESRNAAAEIFSLATDFDTAVAALPIDRPQGRNLKLLEEALQRDVHFIDRHREDYPQGLFQCLWNSCWWYDCREAARYFPPSQHDWPAEGPPWRRQDPKLSALLESWHAAKMAQAPSLLWLRSLRPPPTPFGGPQKRVFRGHYRQVNSTAFSPDGKRVVSGSDDHTIKVWDAATSRETLTLKGHTESVTSVAFSPDGKRIVSGSNDRTVRLWDAASGGEILTLKGHMDSVTSVAFSPDGKQIVSGSNDHTVRVWDATSGNHETCAPNVCGRSHLTLTKNAGPVLGVAISPDGRRIAAGTKGNIVRVWDVLGGQENLTFEGHGSWVTSVAFSPDGQRIASGSLDKTVKVWDAASGQKVVTLEGHTGWVQSVAFSPNGERITSGSWDATVKVWDASSGRDLLTLEGHPFPVLSVAYSPNGSQIASGSRDCIVKLWDVATVFETPAPEGHTDFVQSVAFSPNGDQIASGSRDKTIKVWNGRSGEWTLTLKGHAGSVSSVAFSPDGKSIVSGSWDRTVKVWNGRSGQETVTLKGHEGPVSSVAFSRDGKRIVSGSWDRTVKIWDESKGKETQAFKGHNGGVTSVMFSPDGKHVASGVGDGILWTWNVQSGTCLGSCPDGDVAAVVAGPRKFPFWAIASGLETEIHDQVSHRIIAWFALPLAHRAPAKSGRLWAASLGKDLYLLSLEGNPTSGPDCFRQRSFRGKLRSFVRDTLGRLSGRLLLRRVCGFLLHDLVGRRRAGSDNGSTNLTQAIKSKTLLGSSGSH